MAAPATITLHHDTLQWSTLPHHYVTVVVTHTERIRTDSRGNTVGHDGSGFGRAEADGSVDVKLNRGTGRRFLPFDTIAFETTDLPGTVLNRHSVSVPELRADATVDGRAIIGRAPPGEPVHVEVDALVGESAPLALDTVADPDGNFTISLPDGAQLARGQGAWVSLDDASGNVYRTRVAPFALRLMLNEAVAIGWLTPADLVALNYRTAPNDEGVTYPRRISLLVDSPAGRRYGSTTWASRLTAGAPVTVTIESEVLPTREISGLTIPSISVSRGAGNTVTGTAPPSSELALEVFDDIRSQPILVLPATSDSAGTWQAELSEEAFAAGNHIVVATGLGQGLEIAARLRAPRFTVAVDGATFIAELAPYALFEASFWSPEWSLNGSTGQLRASDEGSADLELRRETGWTTPPGELSYLNRGGAIEVDVAGAGDPRLLEIPRIYASTDIESDVVSGAAPAGSTLAVEILTQDSQERFDVLTDAAGQWQLDLSGTIDLQPGMGARVWLTDRNGHRFYLDTAPVLISAHSDTSTLWIAPTSGRPMRAEVRDPDGRVVGTGTGFAMESSEGEDRRLALTWTGSVVLADRFGANPPLAVGDTLNVQVGDDVASWELPSLEGRIDPELNLMVGDTIPGAPVRVIAGELLEPLTPVIETVADDVGRFRADFAGRADLALGGGAYAEVRDGLHTLLRFVRSPSVVVHYDRGLLVGSLEPRVNVTARVFEGDSIVASGSAMTRGSGTYSLVLRDAAGRGFALRGGHRVEITAPEAELVKQMDVELPAFGVDVSSEERTIGGARPEGYFFASAGVVHRDWPMPIRYIELSEEDAPEGNWLAALSRALHPGDHFSVSVSERGEHGFVRYHREPMLAVEHGGDSVCGFVPPLADVDLKLLSQAGAAKGAASARAESDGIVDLEWRDEVGNPVASEAGDRVSGRVGAHPIAIEMGVFTATLSTAEGGLTAQIRPGGYPILTAPARDCMFELSRSDSAWLSSLNTSAYRDSYGLWRVPEDGRVSLRLPDKAMRERGVALHFDSADGHRVYRTVYRPLLLEADVATGEMRGTGIPGATVDLTILDAAGVQVASARADVDAAGRFSFPFDSSALAAGCEVSASMTAPRSGPVSIVEDETAEMEVEMLDVDPSRQRIVGSAPMGRPVRLIVRLSDGSDQRLKLTTGEDGRFSFANEELPPRSTWDLADVVSGRAELDQPGGHMTVATWDFVRHRPIFLPWTSAAR